MGRRGALFGIEILGELRMPISSPVSMLKLYEVLCSDAMKGEASELLSAMMVTPDNVVIECSSWLKAAPLTAHMEEPLQSLIYVFNAVAFGGYEVRRGFGLKHGAVVMRHRNFGPKRALIVGDRIVPVDTQLPVIWHVQNEELLREAEAMRPAAQKMLQRVLEENRREMRDPFDVATEEQSETARRLLLESGLIKPRRRDDDD